MPNPSELERRAQEDRPLPEAEAFEITIDFGPHQARMTVDKATAGALTDETLSAAIGRELVPHIRTMLEAEEKMHG